MRLFKVYLGIFLFGFIITVLNSSSGLEIQTFKVPEVGLDPKIHNELIKNFKEYIKIKTIRGDEHKASVFIQSILNRHGIKSTILKLPGKGNRSILLSQTGINEDENKGIILAGHSDVVEADLKKWSVDPFSAMEKNNIIYGRGTIDMKSLTMMQLYSYIWMYKNIKNLKRKVMFLLLPGEENGGVGAVHLIKNFKKALDGYGYMLNEGALFTKNTIVDGLNLINIQYAEKGALWFKARAIGESGHGSTPTKNYAAKRMLGFIADLQRYFNKRKITPEMEMFLYQLGSKAPALKGFFLKRVNNSLIRRILEPTFQSIKHLNAMTSDTLSITGLRSSEGESGVNVIGTIVEAKFDIRMLPGTTVTQLKKVITKFAQNWDIKLYLDHAMDPTQSKISDPIFSHMASAAQTYIANTVVAPLLSPGGTDNSHFRRLGMQCYGFFPAILTPKEIGTMHGVDERISRENLVRGTQIYMSFLQSFVQ